MKTVKHTQVVIVGAGPTGLSMAVQLLRYDVDFIILEKRDESSEFSKAIAVQARSLEIFAETGLAENAVADGSIIKELDVFKSGKRKVKLQLKNLGEGISPYPFVLSLEQYRTEKLLTEHLSAHGKKISWNSTYTGFEEDNNGIRVYYTAKNGQDHVIHAQYMLGADGASSILRDDLGLHFKGDTVPKLFYVADVCLHSQIIVKSKSGNEGKFYLFLLKSGFLVCVPLKGERNYRLVGILPQSKYEDPNLTFDDLIPSINEHLAIPVTFVKTHWFSTYKIHTRKALKFRKGRGFIAGDAAHIHTPAGGQGMNTGIQDAYNLAWKMALRLQGKVNEGTLESYSMEREQNAVHLLKTTDRLFDMMAGTHWFWNFLRLRVFPVVMGYASKHHWINKYLFPLLSQTGIRYHNSPLTLTSKVGQVKAGVRMPYFVFSQGKNIFEYLAEPCFKIIFFGEEGKDSLVDFKDGGLSVLKLTFVEIPRAIFRNNRNFYVLLRPDNHISYIGHDLDKCNGLIKKMTI